MDFPESPYSKELIATSEMIKNAISPTLAIVNEMNPVSENIRKYMESNYSIAPLYKMDSSIMKTIEASNRSIAEAVGNSIEKYTQHLNMPNLNIADRIIASMPKTYYPDVSKLVKPFTFDMSKYDFRIGVASQELEQVFAEESEEASEKLLFKETSEPSNELEAQFFDILNQQREVLNDSIKLLEKINTAENKDVTEKPSDEKHDSPAFYKDKMWYAEEVASNLLSLLVSAIFAKTIGVDPNNTIAFVLLLGCLIRFIRQKP
ncbi:hypothetical protein [Enterococcus sp. HMSC072H05]|uniref:hypothetical protein n=1 Tax=Enterococcus sp. HMSC072H05 TaxID=1715012 RepID=UPI00356204D0